MMAWRRRAAPEAPGSDGGEEPVAPDTVLDELANAFGEQDSSRPTITIGADDGRALMQVVREPVEEISGYVLRSEIRLVGFEDES